MTPESVSVMLRVIVVLERLDVPYLIGGSMASAVHGVVRTTLDADIVADLRPEHAAPFVQALGDDFYADVDAIQDAIRRQSSFNVIHLDSAFKVDVFVFKRRPFDQAQMERRGEQVIATNPDRAAYVASAEDTVLSKLEWYRMGGEVSERQWRDVLGVLKTQSDRLNFDYLRHWAAQLNVTDLLERALSEVKE